MKYVWAVLWGIIELSVMGLVYGNASDDVRAVLAAIAMAYYSLVWIIVNGNRVYFPFILGMTEWTGKIEAKLNNETGWKTPDELREADEKMERQKGVLIVGDVFRAIAIVVSFLVLIGSL